VSSLAERACLLRDIRAFMGNLKLMINDEILERRQSFRKVLGARVFSTQPGIRAKATDSLQAIPEIKISQLTVCQKSSFSIVFTSTDVLCLSEEADIRADLKKSCIVMTSVGGVQ